MHGYVCLQEVVAEAAQSEQSGCREDVTPTAAEEGESGDESRQFSTKANLCHNKL
jgi:hypothetical protein